MEDYIDWYCDNCDANLNRQSGFSTSSGSWTCTECGAENDVTENNILGEDEETYQTECQQCGGHMRNSTYSSDLWICEDCGAEVKQDEYGLLWSEDEEE